MGHMANDLARFEGDAEDFARQCRRLRNDYETLGTQMNALQDMWTGEAHDALAARFATDYQALERMVAYAEAMAQSLRGAARAYDGCEHAVARTIDSIRV